MSNHKPITLQELYDRLDALRPSLTPEQLAEPVRWWGDDRGGEVLAVDVLPEEHITVGEGYEPRSLFKDDQPDEIDILGRVPKGAVLLRVD